MNEIKNILDRINISLDIPEEKINGLIVRETIQNDKRHKKMQTLTREAVNCGAPLSSLTYI